MPVVACLQHLERPFTGHAGRALAAAGVEVESRDLRRGDPLPEPGEVDGLVAFGGEQSAIGDELAAEAAYLGAAARAGVPVLGVCLGAQLLSRGLGGRVWRLRRPMLAWTPLVATEAATGDPVLGALPAGAAGLRWNEDGFSVPPGAAEPLRRHGEGAEAFRAGPYAWGVQFHPEVDEEALEGWYRAWPSSLAEAGVTEAPARAADARHMPGQAALSEAIFGGFAKVVRARARERSPSLGGS